MKKVIVLALLLLFAVDIHAWGIGDQLTQAQLDRIDFNTFDLQDQTDSLKLMRNANNELVLYRNYWYLDAIPVQIHQWNGNSATVRTVYEINWDYTPISLNQWDLFEILDCIRKGDTITNCTNPKVAKWNSQKDSALWQQRRHLKSLQTGGAPEIPSQFDNIFT